MEESQKRAQFSAALGIIGFINVPIVFLSIQWWENTIHPNVVQKGGGGMHPDMFVAMQVCLFVFTIIYISLSIFSWCICIYLGYFGLLFFYYW